MKYQAFFWSKRMWDKYVDYYYAEKRGNVPAWCFIIQARYSDNNKWYGY